MAAMTTAEVATEFGTTPRNLRKFLRADAKGREVPNPGKGSRWSIEKRDLRALRSRYAKWATAQDEARAAREATAEAPEAIETDALEA